MVKGSSLSSVVGSTARFLTLQMERPSSSSITNEETSSSTVRKSTENLHRATSSIAHRRSNTLPTRTRKHQPKQTSTATHLSPTYRRHESIPEQTQPSSLPFSPSMLPMKPRRRIRAIDDTDEGESQTSSTIHRDDER